ncbi:MAG: hypothetical protein ABSC64_19900, partial [Candidatus Korobacteraceae bacterium]
MSGWLAVVREFADRQNAEIVSGDDGSAGVELRDAQWMAFVEKLSHASYEIAMLAYSADHLRGTAGLTRWSSNLQLSTDRDTGIPTRQEVKACPKLLECTVSPFLDSAKWVAF